jgi:hypothetical protein
MRKILFVFVCLGLLLGQPQSSSAVQLYSESDVVDLVAMAPAAEQYPQAGAIVLLHQRVIQYNADKSAVTNEHLVIKILQDRGKDTYGDIKRRYNKDSDSLVVVKAVTYLADGAALPVETKAINDITPADLSNASIYSNIMQKVISFPGLAPGVSIELKLRTYSRAPEKGEELFVHGGDLFQGRDPIFHKEISLIVPQDINIRYTVQNEGLDYSAAAENEMVTSYTWSVDNSPQIIEEPFMPSMNKIAPRLIYTNSTSWENLGSWFAGKFYPHVKIDGEIDKEVKSLTKGATTNDEKIRSICLSVIKDIRGIGEWSLPLGLAGYEPHDADIVLANKYGDWRDKTVLLVSLLKAAGIESYPAFVHRDAPPLAQDYPTLKQFNSIFVYVPNYQGQPLWVNCFADNSAFGYLPEGQGATGFVVKQSSFEMVSVVETHPEANQSACRFELSVKPDGNVDGTIACQLSGLFDGGARSQLKDATPKEVEQFFLTSANTVGEGGKSVSYKMTDLKNLLDSVKIAQTFSTPEMGVVQGTMMILHVPQIPFAFAQLPFYPAQTVRNYNFAFATRLSVKKDGVINLPTGYKAVFVSEPVKIENSFGIWEAAYKLNADSTTVQYTSDITLVDKDITTDEYSEFKKAFDDFTMPRNTMILLEKR